MAEYFEYIVGKDGTTRLVRDTESVHVTNIVTEFQENADNQHVPSERLVKDAINNLQQEMTEAMSQIDLPSKEDVANKVSAFQDTPDNQHYPSEKLVYDTLFALHQSISGEIAGAVGAIDVVTTKVVDSLDDVVEPDEGYDYIVKNGNSYLFYKYINNEWKMIGGAMASVGTELPETGDGFTDYYIATETENVYLHYRWLENSEEENGGHFYSIGADSYDKDEIYTKDEVNALVGPINTAVSQQGQRLTELENDVTALSGNMVTDVSGNPKTLTVRYKDGSTSIVTIDDGVDKVTDVNLTDEGIEIVYSDGSTKPIAISGGGGGGTISGSVTITRITDATVTYVSGDECPITYRLDAVDSAGDTVGAGTATWYVGGVYVANSIANQGRNTFDLAEYLNAGSNTIRLVISVDTGGESPSVVSKTWTVNLVNMYITWDYDDTTINEGQNFTLRWTPYGTDVSKTTHVIIDGIEATTSTTTRSGSLQSVTLGRLAHGSHRVTLYCTATVNDTEITSNSISHDMIFVAEGNTTPIIACSVSSFEVKQYNTLRIPVVIYTPNSITSDATLKVDGELFANWTDVDRSVHYWNYAPTEPGDKVLTIQSGSTVKTLNIEVSELGYDIEPVTSNLEFDFNPVGLSNSSENRLWRDKDHPGIGLSVSDNFDWNNGGYQTDENGNAYFCVKAGTRAYINYSLFGNDPKTDGSEFKVIFRVTNVQNKDATFLTCLSPTANDNAGLKMDVHEARVFTSSDELLTHYSEDDVIEFEYNINAINLEDANSTSFIMTYEDGVAARPLIYSNDSGYLLYQLTPVPITIGSDYCDTFIYRMKAYSAALSDSDILTNFIADSRDSETMIARYERNQIYNGNHELTPESVANACPDLRVIMIECPHFTNDKKDYVRDTTVRCIYKNGDPSLDNWTYMNGYHAGQGTSSNKYGLAGRNIDIIFGFDGEHQVVSKIDLDPDYISTLTLGDGTVLSGKDAKVTLSRTSVPNDWFNIKVNIASSENTNNAVLQKRYNDYLPYKTPGQKRNPFIKNSMEFANCVVFLKERDPDIATHREFADTNWHFYAIGNIGDSKKTDNTRVNDPTDMAEFVVEFSDNTLPNSTFSSGVYLDANGNVTYNFDERVSDVYPITNAQWVDPRNLKRKSLYEDWDGSFEFRYDMGTKDGETIPSEEIEAQQERSKQVLRNLYEFIIMASDEDFVSHLGDWFIVESPLYWYLFTERYTMIDNRAKNTFWHYGKTYITELEAIEMGDDAQYYTVDDAAAAINNGYRFDLWNYDDDTSLGIDNNGELNMTFGHEDVDYKTEGDPASGYIYNGADSIFWRRIRQLMNRQLRSLYVSRESLNCWSASSLITEFDNWQSQFPEELWRIDIERKYIRPYTTGNPVAGIAASQDFLKNMMNGRKKYQRRQFERDQEIYIGTKYFGTNQCADSRAISFRCNTPQTAVVRPDYTLRIVPYSDMYLSVAYGNTAPQSIRAKGGQEYVFTTDLTTMDDTIILIYCAENIQALNDLSACYIRANDFSAATRLKTLIIGSTVPGYTNQFITTLSIKDNRLLETLDIRNCTSLTGSLNFSGCQNLEEFYAENTAITGVTFARNGKIRLAHLPDTISSLTLNNLHYLDDLQIAGYDRMVALVSEYCTLDPLPLLRSAINTLQIVQILGIDWEFTSTEILNKVYSMSSSVLAGDVVVNGPVRQRELDNYAELWPNLNVTYTGELVPQYYVYFVNDDGTELYRMLVDRGSVAIDPLAEGLIPTPTKESTDQYDFTFDGWDNLPGTIVAEKTVTARYSHTVRSYTVEWYWHRSDTTPKYTKTVQYGKEANYVGERPSDTSGEATLNYRLWSGWDKSTGSVKENLKVYATWNTQDGLPQVGKDMNEMGPAELYAVSTAKMPATYFDEKDTKDIRFGSDFDFDNVTSELLAENEYFNGSRYLKKNIKLFGEDAPAYTIAFDFEFNSTNTNGATLLSCCDSSRSYEGFRLYYAGGPKITWLGSSAVAVGAAGERNILVMRHVQGSPNIMLYVFNTTNAANYDDNMTIVEIPGVNLPTTDETITFGAQKYGNSFEAYSKAWVHWCKIWYDDLGEETCKKLASWPHTTLRVEYCGQNINPKADGSGRAAMTFIAGEALPLYHTLNMNNAKHGWTESTLREFCNSRVFDGLSYEWQSAIKLVSIKSLESSASSAIMTTDDYLYVPALADLGIYSTIDPYSGELSNSDVGQISYYTTDLQRMKFFIPVEDREDTTPGRQVIVSTSDPTSLSRYTVAQGDIWRRAANGPAYIYISADYVSKHTTLGRYDLTTIGAAFGIDPVLRASDGGAWVLPCSYWTRTPVQEESYATDYYFNITANGASDYQSPRNQMGIVIGFSI